MVQSLDASSANWVNLAELEALSLDTQLDSMLIDTGAARSPADPIRQPASIEQPLSVSRVQSSYQSAGLVDSTLVFTFTVTNNQSPLQIPAVRVRHSD